ncbi:hypothetical protein OKW41_006221 [Paraburkholderia sp. UCT70]
MRSINARLANSFLHAACPFTKTTPAQHRGKRVLNSDGTALTTAPTAERPGKPHPAYVRPDRRRVDRSPRAGQGALRPSLSSCIADYWPFCLEPLGPLFDVAVRAATCPLEFTCRSADSSQACGTGMSSDVRARGEVSGMRRQMGRPQLCLRLDGAPIDVEGRVIVFAGNAGQRRAAVRSTVRHKAQPRATWVRAVVHTIRFAV